MTDVATQDTIRPEWNLMYSPTSFYGLFPYQGAAPGGSPAPEIFLTTNIISWSTTASVSSFVSDNVGSDPSQLRIEYFLDDQMAAPVITWGQSQSVTQQFSIGNLSEGAHTLTAYAVDGAGNRSLRAETFSFTVDTTRPYLEYVDWIPEPEGIDRGPGNYYWLEFSEPIWLSTSLGGGASDPGWPAFNSPQWQSVFNINSDIEVYRFDGNAIGPSSDLLIFVPASSVSGFDAYGILRTPPAVVSAGRVSDPEVLESPDFTGQNESWFKIEFDSGVPSGSVISSSLRVTDAVGGAPVWPESVRQDLANDRLVYAKFNFNTLLRPDGTQIQPEDLRFESNLGIYPSIVDEAGNLIHYQISEGWDDILELEASTLGYGEILTTLKPQTGVAGVDTLDLTEFGGQRTISYTAGYAEYIENLSIRSNAGSLEEAFRIDGFERFVVNATKFDFRGSSTLSEIVQVKDVAAAATQHILRFGNLTEGSPAPETDVVDYSQTNSSISVDLSVKVQGFSVVSRGPAGQDLVSGAEGIFGSKGNDQIAGDGNTNIFWGGTGADVLSGRGGDDVLFGGTGLDTIIGGSGRDIIFDFGERFDFSSGTATLLRDANGEVQFDGDRLTGGETGVLPRESGAQGEGNIFVVSRGSTITDYHLAKSGAGLQGRGERSANDIIIFNLALGILTSGMASGLDPVQREDLLETVRDDVVSELDRYIVVSGEGGDRTVSLEYVYQGDTYTLGSVSLEGIGATLGANELSAVALKNWQIPIPATGDFRMFGQAGIDPVFVMGDEFFPDDSFKTVSFVLEAVKDGTIRTVSGAGLMAGGYEKAERIFNPGSGDEKILGGSTKDTVQFLLQDFRGAAATDSVSPGPPNLQAAGRDRILDTGGNSDLVEFSNLLVSDLAYGYSAPFAETPLTAPAADLSYLSFRAIQVGREPGLYSLEGNYSQGDSSVANYGTFTWLGHFREGMDMSLEQVKLGDTVLEMARVGYDYNANGRLISPNPSQAASGGKDTIMVGDAGIGGASKFIVTGDAIGEDKDAGFFDDVQKLYLWGVDASQDVLDLDAFFNSAEAAKTAIVDQQPAPAGGIGAVQPWIVDLDGGLGNVRLEMYFYGSSVSELQLEEMIARANYS